jgi:hypothetical protein
VGIDDGVEYAHRVVASAFHGSIPTGMHVCHYDGEKTNNRAENLRIDTPAGNAFDSLFHRDRDRVFTTELYDQVHIGLFDLETDELVHCFGPIVSVIAERKVMGDDDLVRKAQIGINRWKARKAVSQG